MAGSLDKSNNAVDSAGLAAARTTAKRSADCIDLTSDDDEGGPTCSNPATKRPRTDGNATTRQATPVTSLPTPDPTPQKPKGLYDHPEIAERYAAKTVDGVDHTNPQKFTLKPACWKSWKPRHYAKLAEHMRAQFNPFPFAEEEGLPVDEVKHVFSGLVCNPLYFADEATRRGEEGMGDLIELYTKYGTPTRAWGKPMIVDGVKTAVYGELSRVSAGKVELITRKGSKTTMKLSELTEVDKKYLKDTLTNSDKMTLWETNDALMDFRTAESLL